MGSIPIPSEQEIYDVIVVGGGNAGFSAATTAAQTLRSLSPSSTTTTPLPASPAKVLLLEKAPEESSGGNTFYTAGAYRFTFDSLSDLLPILSHDDGKPGLPDDLITRIVMPPYRASDFLEDMNRVTSGRADPALTDVLISRSRAAVDWMHANGGRWELSFHRQAYEVDGQYKFFGGLVVCFADGGKGLVEWHRGLARREGVEVCYGCPAVRLIVDGATSDRVIGVEVLQDGQRKQLFSRGGVVLASGGFQASPTLRAQHLGPNWELAHVRGCEYSTGDGHQMLFPTSPDIPGTVSAERAGDYPGCHSVCWDARSPADGGDRVLTNQYTKSGYPLGIMVNVHGQRFVDEGQDLRNYTYAVFGRRVLEQDGGRAWQVWDARGRALLRKEEYAPDVTELIETDTLDELADRLVAQGMRDKSSFLATLAGFNDACTTFARENPDVKFDPAVKDGLSTQSKTSNESNLSLPKSNWARSLVEPPFTAVQVTCGITFTFGGAAIVPETAQVVASATSKGIEGLYACGELVGGLFWGNYPGGSGLTAGTVFGRIAGEHAARRAVKQSGK